MRTIYCVLLLAMTTIFPTGLRAHSTEEGGENVCVGHDIYLEGYLQALIDMNYHEHVKVHVSERKVELTNLPENHLSAESIMAFVKQFPAVGEREVVAESFVKRKDVVKQPSSTPEKDSVRPRTDGVWFPQSTVLFQPLVADPRQVTYSLAYRCHDNILGTKGVGVSFGDNLPIFRWFDVLPWKGDLQVNLEGGIWAVFDANGRSSASDVADLVNTDFFVSIPVTYAVDNWSFRLRLAHLSSHLGDEYLITYPSTVRKNLSRESIDFFASYQIIPALRLYGGIGRIIHCDKSFRIHPLYVEYGGELRLFGRKDVYNKLFLQPFFAVHCRNWEDMHWNMDTTCALGLEWSKLHGIGRKMRVALEYHDGYSLEGQFVRQRSDYFAVKISYGF